MKYLKIFLGKLILFLTILIPGKSFCQHIVVDKPNLRLYVINESDTTFNVPIACGKYFGDKTAKNDYKTPEGSFTISKIQNSNKWKHDFKDGKGLRKNAYGPLFIRLKAKNWKGIGIHGTCFPESIGTRDTEGCIRLRNEDLLSLRNYIYVGMRVIILPDSIY